MNWPVGLGGKGNEGVSGQIKQTPGAIGYVELIYAMQNKMPYADMKNCRRRIRKADAGVDDRGAGDGTNSRRLPFFDDQRAGQGCLSDRGRDVAAGL